MNSQKWKEANRREHERQEMTDILNRGRRDINNSLNEFEGWADRVMRAVLRPMGDDIKTIWDPQGGNNAAAYRREE